MINNTWMCPAIIRKEAGQVTSLSHDHTETNKQPSSFTPTVN